MTQQSAHATDPSTSERGPLWSALDWCLWGVGLGDRLREPMADAMLAALPPEQRAQAEELIAWWSEKRGGPVGENVYQGLSAEHDYAAAQLRAVRTVLDQFADDPAAAQSPLWSALTEALLAAPTVEDTTEVVDGNDVAYPVEVQGIYRSLALLLGPRQARNKIREMAYRLRRHHEALDRTAQAARAGGA